MYVRIYFPGYIYTFVHTDLYIHVYTCIYIYIHVCTNQYEQYVNQMRSLCLYERHTCIHVKQTKKKKHSVFL